MTDASLPDFLKNRFEKCFSKPQNNICYLTGKLSAPVYFGLSKPLRKIPEQELLAGTTPHIIMVPEDSMEYVPLGRYRVQPSSTPERILPFTHANGEKQPEPIASVMNFRSETESCRQDVSLSVPQNSKAAIWRSRIRDMSFHPIMS
ncbi:MAG: hypothetical protein V8T87_00365 [Victivallales bacterium]